MKNIICQNCGWMHFAKTEQSIREHAQLFKDYFDTLGENAYSKTGYKDFSVEEAVEKQKKCFKCGATDLKVATQEEIDNIPTLSTIQAIIFE